MPTVPRNEKCSHLGCKNPRTRYGGQCIDHGGSDTQRTYINADRREAMSLYDTGAWQKMRARQLSVHPLCQSCLINGHVRQATDIDHVFPWRRLGKEAFYANLLQSLCHECHSSKTALERQGICRHYEGQIKDYAIDDYYGVTLSHRLGK